MIKVLNLYAGIGGNRKLWPNDKIEVTAVEIEPKIAKIYQDFFPNDKVIVADAHQFLLEHFKEFDFIWSSPPCPSHSGIRKELGVEIQQTCEAIYPDMKLYEEILFLQGYFKGKFVVENVVSWYRPLIEPYTIERHYFWTNFNLVKKDFDCLMRLRDDTQQEKQESLGFNISEYDGIDKTKCLRNCVNPKVAEFIFNMAFSDRQKSIGDML